MTDVKNFAGDFSVMRGTLSIGFVYTRSEFPITDFVVGKFESLLSNFVCRKIRWKMSDGAHTRHHWVANVSVLGARSLCAPSTETELSQTALNPYYCYSEELAPDHVTTVTANLSGHMFTDPSHPPGHTDSNKGMGRG
ncbi:hypothetical protein AB205_0169570 [Aquarana catesbeiana]|uniref:Uncharacterized protein n=1 Tax=Aquarana catesbeiana TaxID=8400 RepID=A0A2G9R8I6_AQUCT|nr:hypothetical protein AB205_0169570 [Aquarana catesbeiana]